MLRLFGIYAVGLVLMFSALSPALATVTPP